MGVSEPPEVTHGELSVSRSQLECPVCSYDPEDAETLLWHIIVTHEVRL
jgi:hypothetical protein